MESPNPSGGVINCSFCGRDTRSKVAICVYCKGKTASEMRGRTAQVGIVLGGTPFRDVDDEESPPRAIEQYHGPTIRDDL